MPILQGKVALITGGAGGLGSEIARAFAGAGATVCIADLSLGEADRCASAIGGDAFGLAMNVTESASIDRAIKAVVERTGRLDILVNNAGVYGLQPWLDITPDDFDRIFAVNVRGFLFVLQAAARQMQAQASGVIINIASGAGRRGNPLSVVYSASKACVINLNQSAALALAAKGVRVNAIAPGGVLTPMWETVDALNSTQMNEEQGGMTARFAGGVPLGRISTPRDYVGAALFLASDASAYMTGQTLNIDGGLFLN